MKTIQATTLSMEITKKVQMDYLISFPEGYKDQKREWGCFLHGMDMWGEDVTQQFSLNRSVIQLE